MWLVCLFLPDLVSQFVLRSFVDIVVTVCFIVEKGINTFCLIYISCSLPNFSTENWLCRICTINISDIQCLATVNISPEELPPNFTASQLTEIKKRGKLIFSSYKLFQLICVVEENFLKLAKHDQVFMKDAYEAILLLISGSKLPFIGCQTHQTSLMSDVIFQYLTLRFRCFGKKRFVDVVEKKRGEQHARIKMKKLRTFARKWNTVTLWYIAKAKHRFFSICDFID